MAGSYGEYLKRFNEVTKSIKIFKGGIFQYENEFKDILLEIINVKLENKTVYIVGNGASAAMASHMVVDLWKNLGIRSFTLTDNASITAVGNDIGYEQSYSYPLKICAQTNDLLITISSSGSSQNIVSALNTAKELGMKSISLSGMSEDNKSIPISNFSIFHPGKTYGEVETGHALILHYIVDTIYEQMKT